VAGLFVVVAVIYLLFCWLILNIHVGVIFCAKELSVYEVQGALERATKISKKKETFRLIFLFVFDSKMMEINDFTVKLVWRFIYYLRARAGDFIYASSRQPINFR
jgi:hypothetical protein